MKILLILLKFNNMEIWKTITDYPNYQVSNYGIVVAIDKIKLKDNIIVKIKNNIVVETIK